MNMRHIKMLGLLTVAAAAMMASAGTASATITSGGSAYTGEIVASSTNFEMDGVIDIKCKQSTLAGSASSGATTFAINSMGFTECGSDTVMHIPNTEVILKDPTIHSTDYGSLAVASDGTISLEFAYITVQVHRTVFGFPVTTHCLYETDFLTGTDIGKLTEGTTNITIASANIPQKPTDTSCGTSAQWTGNYTISKPGALTID